MLRRFLGNPAASGIVLMLSAVSAFILANSPLADRYVQLLHSSVGPLSLHHWINDGLMAVFFLLVGLEIKREVMGGELATWRLRMLPGIAAAGGMLVPALIFLALNTGPTAPGWAIPAATDIAFALGVLALLGSRVPVSLKVFLTALAIIDDLGAVLIIALFYTGALSLVYLAGAGAVVVVLVGLNRCGVRQLWPYLLLGAVMWWLMLHSGIHATLAGVVLAFTIPVEAKGARPLERLEHALQGPVGFLILPVFGLANAGVTLLGLPEGAWVAPVTLGVTGGLLLGKLVGVFGFAMGAIKLKIADMPTHASMRQMLGVALLCGIGFTMSLFITLLAFPGDAMLQAEAKIGILAGSLLSGLLGYGVLRAAGAARK